MMFDLRIFFFLLSLHLLGDFYCQSQKLSDAKRRSQKALWRHALLYSLVQIPSLFLGWPYWLLMAGAHLLIDQLKYFFERKGKCSEPSSYLFLIDQVLHVTAIILISIFCLRFVSDTQLYVAFGRIPLLLWRWLALLLLIGKPANVSFRVIYARFQPQSSAAAVSSSEDGESSSLPNDIKGAGAAIGVMERFFTVLFASLGAYTAFAFLMTAKSVARFNRLSTDQAFAEYYLLGTLYSVLFAFVAHSLLFILL